MGKKFAQLQRIDNDQKITKDTHSAFMHLLQNSLLLALKEQGRLTEMQYRYAAEQLSCRQRERARKRIREGGGEGCSK